MPNAIKLPHKLDRKTMTCQAVIETPKGARSKFDYDEESGLFRLHPQDDGTVTTQLLSGVKHASDNMRFNDGRCDRHGRAAA